MPRDPRRHDDALRVGTDDLGVLDLRTYRLVPGSRDSFDRIFREELFPLHHHARIHVVGYGPSLTDDEHYFLARAFGSMAERDEQLGAYYDSDAWRNHYEPRIMSLVESFHVVVVSIPGRTREILAASPLGEVAD